MPNSDTDFEDSDSRLTTNKAPEHLNNYNLRIQISDKGRGVYSTKNIPYGTIIEISPVLLFKKEEYEAHGQYTVLDQYTYKWRDGRMALALGLGSLFNHSETPNVSYVLDPSNDSIRYMTTKPIDPHQELCIFYGHNLWFEPVSINPLVVTQEETDDGWGGLSAVANEVEESRAGYPSFVDGNPCDIISVEDLPFTRLKVTGDDDELDGIQTIQVWVVDIPNPRHITTMLNWLKVSGLESPKLGHLKRIRKQGVAISLLLGDSPDFPPLPTDLNLSEPYTLAVPRTAALTTTALQLKSSLWPTIFAPRRKGEIEPWPRAKVKWAWDSMRAVVEEAARAQTDGELPIVAHVPASFEDKGQLPLSFVSRDTRRSSGHPLRHAVLNVIRRIADYRASASDANDETAGVNPTQSKSDADGPQNGSHYLLTSLTLFTTHEPCIMCSMALLHSRVKEVFYLIPMEKTGGCGGLTCLPKLDGVNHRFGISRWKHQGDSAFDVTGLVLDEAIDV